MLCKDICHAIVRGGALQHVRPRHWALRLSRCHLKKEGTNHPQRVFVLHSKERDTGQEKEGGNDRLAKLTVTFELFFAGYYTKMSAYKLSLAVHRVH